MLFLLLLSSLAYAGENTAWIRLFHPGSGLKGDGFYLSNERTPEKELDAFVREVKLGSGDGNVRCRFPARFRVVKGMGLVSGERGSCPKFDRWRALIRPRGVELVLASAFVNSPSSMYGHVFLKFPRAGIASGNDLLDYAASFGADTGNSGGVGYVWNGLTGGFPGFFSTAPFYVKVKEYGQMESRDLWIYSLDFTQSETELLLEHLWELRDVKFPYYFLSRNCAYYLLEFLDVARPSLHLASDFPLWAIPMDIIRTLEEAKLVRGREIRPSLLSTLERKRRALSPKEEEWAYRVGQNVEELKNVPKGLRRNGIADAAYDLFRYRRGVARENDPASLNAESTLLEARGSFRVQTNSDETPPDEGHKSSRIGASFGAVKRGNGFGAIHYRGALHDLLDPPEGYEPHSAVAMGDFVARWQNRRFIVENADLLKIESIAPTDTWVSHVAWNFLVGFDQAHWIPCEGWHCSEGKADGGAGLSFRLFPHDDVAAFIFLNSALRAGPVFTRSVQWDAGPRGGVFLPVTKNWRILFEGERRFSFLGGSEPRISGRASTALDLSRDSEVRLSVRKERRYEEGLAVYFRYF